jgi:hypothetical protein
MTEGSEILAIARPREGPKAGGGKMEVLESGVLEARLEVASVASLPFFVSFCLKITFLSFSFSELTAELKVTVFLK